MKIKLKNSNLSLANNEIQNKSSIESLYITDCPRITNTWDLLQSILTFQDNNNNKILERVRLDSIDEIGFLYDLDRFINNSGLKGIKDNGDYSNYPALLGTWRLPGIYNDDTISRNKILSIQNNITQSGGDLIITPDSYLIRFSDSVVTSIINNTWAFVYDKDEYGVELYGISEERLAEITDISDCFISKGIRTFTEFKKFTGVTSLINGAFSNNPNLYEIEFPPNLVNVGDGVFSGCDSLLTIEYPSSVSSIGSRQFGNNEDIMHVRIIGDINRPNINIKEDSFLGNYTIYIGDGSSPWHDNKILNNLLQNNVWQLYRNRLSTWYDKLCLDQIPEGYTKMDYLESDGINFINTDEEFTDNTKFIADISFNSLPSNGRPVVYGSLESGITGNLNEGLKFIFKQGSSSKSIYFYNTYDDSWVGNNSEENLYEIDIYNKTLKLNNVDINVTGTNLSSNGGIITLFGNDNGCYVGKTWMTRIYNGEELIHDYIPVYNNSSLHTGFFDTVDNVFVDYGSGSGSNIDTRLITENNDKVIDENDDFLQISEQSTTKVKVSLMDSLNIDNCDNYFVPGCKKERNIPTKKTVKYDLGRIKNSIKNSAEDKIDIQAFKENSYYSDKSIVYFDGDTYKFTADHYGQFNYKDVIKTSAFEEIENLRKLNNKVLTNTYIVEDSPINVEDLINTGGTQYINTGIKITGNHRIEMKFKYNTNFLLNDYIFGSYYTDTYNSTYLKLGDVNNNSGTFKFCGKTMGTIPIGVLTPEQPHEIILDSNGMTIDSTYISYTRDSSGYSEQNTLLLFGNITGNTAVSSSKIYRIPTQSVINLYYFRIYDTVLESYILDLRPVYVRNKLCLAYGSVLYPNIGTGVFSTTTNIETPFNNKEITFKLLDNTLSNNQVETSKFNTDSNGNCLISVRKDTLYKIELPSINGYSRTADIINKYLYDANSNNDIFIYLQKDSIDLCEVTINIVGVNTDISNGKYIHIFSKTSCDYIVEELYNNTVVVKVPKYQKFFIVYPNISNYITPSNYIFNINEESTYQISSTYASS